MPCKIRICSICNHLLDRFAKTAGLGDLVDSILSMLTHVYPYNKHLDRSVRIFVSGSLIRWYLLLCAQGAG